LTSLINQILLILRPHLHQTTRFLNTRSITLQSSRT
jgi:hypothetical protein